MVLTPVAFNTYVPELAPGLMILPPVAQMLNLFPYDQNVTHHY